MIVLLGIVITLVIIVLTVIFSFMENARTGEVSSKPRITAKDFFLHSAILVTLYMSVVSVITLLVQTINAAFPDVLEQSYYYSYQGYSSGMRFAVASLIIVFPVFILLSWWNHRQIARAPELRDLSIRKWFNYLTLFLAGATIVGDLIAFLNTFLGGEISLRFILKVLAVLVVSGFVFLYHLYELRGQVADKNTYRLFRVLSILVVLGAIIWSFVVIGSPATVRAYRLDETRVANLSDIQWQIVNYWQTKRALPTKLSDLEDSISGYGVPVDPETKSSYEYRSLAPLKFELCATFTMPSRSGSMAIEKYPPVSGTTESWEHPTGKYCFERTIDPERYPLADSKSVPIPVR